MAGSEKKERIVFYKLLFTIIILLGYILGRGFPLYGVDIKAYHGMALDAEDLLMQTVGGDAYRYSLFALGISPYIISSITTQMVTAYRKSVSKVKVSMIKTNRATAIMTFLIALVQAFMHVQELKFQSFGTMLWVAQIAAGAEMVTGVMLIMWMSERNKRFGIGGQTVLIIANIMDGMIGTLGGKTLEVLEIPLIVSAVVLPIMILMENTEKRIPVQRISIRNIYADKNYLAVKLNPIGVMPIMFSTAFFMLPQLVVNGLGYFFPENQDIAWWIENMKLTRPLGILCYVGIIYILTIIFSMVMLSPGELSEQFLKSGDSIVDLHSGRSTKRYLRGTIIRISLLSATVMGACVCVPLILQMRGSMDGALVMFPSSIMMLTGLWSNLFREFEAIKSFDGYKSFL